MGLEKPARMQDITLMISAAQGKAGQTSQTIWSYGLHWQSIYGKILNLMLLGPT